jgi:prophage antirepressor-like protein
MGIELKAFQREEFGKLTTLTNPQTGVTMFVAQEVASMWGHTNIRQAIKRLLNPDEYKVVEKKKFPELFEMLVCNKMLQSRAPSIQLVTESAVYKLALASNLDKAKPFRDWVTREVLPSLRQSGSYSFSQVDMKQLSQQTMRTVQIENSKTVNTKHYEESGVPAIIEYNKNNCKQVTGMEPAQIKKMYGKKSKSAKEILRSEQPELAAAMSLNDLFVAKGAKLESLKELDKAALVLFKEMSKIGIIAVE